MKTILIIILLYFIYCKRSQSLTNKIKPKDPEIFLHVPDIIRFYGYSCEIHHVITEDGYILTMHRIPHGLRNTTTRRKPVVFLQHGLLDSSFTWIANGPRKSLGFVLADSGFDVWLANSRGNTYSNRHTKYNSDKNSFWDFTWDDMAKFDLDSSINYVLSVSEAQKLGYVGHSQGTEIAFARFSQKTSLNSKVSAFIALAPIVYLGHIRTALKHLSRFAGSLNFLSNFFGNGEFMYTADLSLALGQLPCESEDAYSACGNLLFLFYGPNSLNINYTRIPIYVKHVPAGTSFKNMAHYGQSLLSKKFQMYDYGFIENIIKYGQMKPPEYRLNTDGLPIAIFWGGNDWLAVPEDVVRAINELGENVKFKKYIADYNHVDFIWGKNADSVLFPEIVNFLLQFAS